MFFNDKLAIIYPPKFLISCVVVPLPYRNDTSFHSYTPYPILTKMVFAFCLICISSLKKSRITDNTLH